VRCGEPEYADEWRHDWKRRCGTSGRGSERLGLEARRPTYITRHWGKGCGVRGVGWLGCTGGQVVVLMGRLGCAMLGWPSRPLGPSVVSHQAQT
jgi:hypothetical protein